MSSYLSPFSPRNTLIIPHSDGCTFPIHEDINLRFIDGKLKHFMFFDVNTSKMQRIIHQVFLEICYNLIKNHFQVSLEFSNKKYEVCQNFLKNLQSLQNFPKYPRNFSIICCMNFHRRFVNFLKFVKTFPKFAAKFLNNFREIL